MKQIIKQSIFVILLFGITCVLVDGRGVSAQTTVKIGTHPVGSSFNVIGSAVGKMIQKHTPLDAKVIPLSGLTSWLPMMPTGEIDLGIATSADSYYAYFGDEDFSVSLLVRYDTIPVNTDRWLIKGTHGGDGTGSRYELFLTSGGTVRFSIDNGPDNIKTALEVPGAPFVTGDWVQVVGVR